MKRKLLTIITIFLFANTYSQVVTCAADAFGLEDTISCNDSTLIIFGETGGGEDFDCVNPLTGQFVACDAAWNTNPGVDFTQPYIASPDGNGYLWMGSQISSQIGSPRTVTSPTYNTTCGGSICFDFVFADGNSGQNGDNEQPDLYDEGIELQFSVAGGPWTPIRYWAPDGSVLPANPGHSNTNNLSGPGPFETWQDDVCVPIPLGAQASQVRFRFEQFDDSGTCCDHWGIDDIDVSINATTMDVFQVSPAGTGNQWTTPDTFAVSPTADSTAYIFYMNDAAYGGTLQVFDTVYVFTEATDAGPDVTVSCSTIGVELSVSGVMPYSDVVWTPIGGLSNNTIQNPYANPTSDQMYTVTSDCGVDSTFVNVVPIFVATASTPNDSVCVNDVATLVATSDQPAVVYTYEWTNYVVNDSVATTTVTPSINTTYYVEMVSDSGCVRTDSVTIFVGAVPKTINYTGEMRLCNGDSTQITVDAIQPTIFDDFDNNGTGINQGIWSDIQNGTANNDCGSVSFLNALHFNGAGDRYAATIPLNVLPSGGTISFDIIYGGFAAPGSSCNFVGFNENVEFQFSTDGGVTWPAANTMTVYGAFADFTWTHITETVPAAAAGPNTVFRVVQPNHSGNDNDNWAIDNFLVELDCSGLGCVNYEYSWSPAATVSDPNILNPYFFPTTTTTYSLSISPEGFNCTSAADMITIEVDELPLEITPADTFLCESATVLLEASIPSSCDYTLKLYDSFGDGWNGNTLDVVADGTNIGNFTLSGALQSDSFTYTFSVPFGQSYNLNYNNTGGFQNEVSYELYDFNNNLIFSDGPNPTVGIAFTSTADCISNIQWSPNTAISDISVRNPLVTPLTTTVYVLEVLNANNCAFYDSATVHVYESNVNITANPNPACEGTPIQLMATGADSFTWTPVNGLSATNIANPISTTTTDITYFVEFNTNGCIDGDSINIDIISLPTAPINNGTNPVEFCEGTEANLFVDQITGWTYAWSGPETGNTNSIDVTTPGSYSVVFNDGTCSNSTNVTVLPANALPTFDFATVARDLCCEDDETEVVFATVVNNVNLDHVYWNGMESQNSSEIIVSNSDGNSITNELNHLRVISDKGCEAETELPIVTTNCANPTINGEDTIYLDTNEVYELTLGETHATNSTFTWTTSDPTNGAITNANVEDATVNGITASTVPYTLGVSVVNTYGDKVCPPEFAQQTKSYEVIEVEDPQFADAFTPKNGDDLNNVYKPVISKFSTIKDFRVYNRWGQLVYDMATADNKEGWDGTWNGQDQEADLYIYYMTIVQPDEEVTKEGTVTLIR